jgi:nitrite reductase (NADH) large subunit
VSTAVLYNPIQTHDAQTTATPIVIVGSGPVGIHFLQSLLAHKPDSDIVMYGNEPWLPYNRVQLSAFIAGDIGWSALTETQGIPSAANITTRFNTAIIEIDPINKVVTDQTGQQQRYSKLVLATGSRPHKPGLAGGELKNIFTFRDLSDAQQLVARRVRSRRTVVIGGGLLGLEAARAMTRYHTEVIVIDHANRLMNQQLDEQASEHLREYMLSLGIRIYLSSPIKQLCGETQVSGVLLRNDTHIACDTVIMATGIRPNMELALAAGISVGRGIKVNDAMQTSDPDIYAVGECTEHNGQVYGLVAPGYEQAQVAAYNLAGKRSSYSGSIAATQLKVVGQSVFSMGELDNEAPDYSLHSLIYENSSTQVYRKLVLRKRRLVGAIAIGEWPALYRIREAISQHRLLWPWQLKRFHKTGEIWPDTEASKVSQWPAGTLVCNCRQVTRGKCSEAIAAGCYTVTEISQATGAATVCGSCKPLLQQMLGNTPLAEPIRQWKTTLTIAALSLLILVAFLFATPVPYLNSAQISLHWDQLWRDGTLKQISGYTTIGLATLGLLMSLRKRISRLTLFDFAIWRSLHLITGLLLLLTLAAHTGLRLGHHLDQQLTLMFLALIVLGVIAAVLLGLQHKFDVVLAKRLKQRLVWLHILLFWPVPALLSWHIFKIYYF